MLETEIRKLTQAVDRLTAVMEASKNDINAKVPASAPKPKELPPAKEIPPVVPASQDTHHLANVAKENIARTKAMLKKVGIDKKRIKDINDLDQRIGKLVSKQPVPGDAVVAVNGVLTQFGVDRLGELDESQFQAFYSFVQEAINNVFA